MKNDDGGSAFPVPYEVPQDNSGMTLRDYFAGQALIRVIPTEGWVDHAVRKEAATAARQAYAIADAMLAERKPKDGAR